MTDRFEKRIAVVTGGASGIGEAVARRIAAEGGHVIAFDRDPSSLERISGSSSILPVQVDIGDEAQVKNSLQRVVDQFGRLDILINSAGIVGPTNTRITEYSSQDFQEVIRVNLLGAFYVTKYAVQAMLPQRYGRILLIASMAGKEGNPGMSGYSTAKAGVIGLVKSIGKEVAEAGITVNAIAPAVIRTPMNEKTAPEQLAYLTERIPMKRLGTVEEVANLACWIVSEEASFTTGFTFDLSGGRATY